MDAYQQTVPGLMCRYWYDQCIAATGSGGLGAVSAGISEALVETALGRGVEDVVALCTAPLPSLVVFSRFSASPCKLAIL